MRFWIVAVCGLFVATSGFGCGGTTIPTPPADAKAGPPPGTSPDMTKFAKDPAKKK